MLSVLFAVCYQSVHAFSHEHHHLNERCAESHHFTFKVSEKTSILNTFEYLCFPINIYLYEKNNNHNRYCLYTCYERTNKNYLS
jgi:hypothetical protein